jgi:ATP-dependent protease ClpP protease subunit
MIMQLGGDVNQDMFSELIKIFNSLSSDDSLHIYFTSETGGSSDIGMAIIAFINENKNRITMSFYGELFSAGMRIFLEVACPKKVLFDARGMFHFSWQEMAINETGKPSGQYDSFCMKEMKRSKERTFGFLKTTKLSDKEINAIMKGKDVYFPYERMTELL